jgi:hypothetical protein
VTSFVQSSGTAEIGMDIEANKAPINNLNRFDDSTGICRILPEQNFVSVVLTDL